VNGKIGDGVNVASFGSNHTWADGNGIYSFSFAIRAANLTLYVDNSSDGTAVATGVTGSLNGSGGFQVGGWAVAVSLMAP